MRIACPSCDAAYEVPDRLLAGPPRTLRCSRCGADFALPGAEAPPPPAPEPAPAPPPPVAEPEAPPPVVPAAPPASLTLPPMRPETPVAVVPVAEPSQASLTRAWAASVLVVAAAMIAFLVFHAEVMEAWPASARLFAALGLT